MITCRNDLSGSGNSYRVVVPHPIRSNMPRFTSSRRSRLAVAELDPPRPRTPSQLRSPPSRVTSPSIPPARPPAWDHCPGDHQPTPRRHHGDRLVTPNARPAAPSTPPAGNGPYEEVSRPCPAHLPHHHSLHPFAPRPRSPSRRTPPPNPLPLTSAAQRNREGARPVLSAVEGGGGGDPRPTATSRIAVQACSLR